MRRKTALALRALDLVQSLPRFLTGPLAWLLAVPLFLFLEREATLSNIARVYPRWSKFRRLRLAFAAYRHATRSLLEFLTLPPGADAEVLERVTVDEREEERFGRALAEGKGALVLTGHYGNALLLARRAVAGGYPLGVLAKRPKDPHLAKRVIELEPFVPIEHGTTRALVRWLREGRPLAVPMDQEPARLSEGAVVPLLGVPTLTHTGPFRLARMTGAPVFTAFVQRVGRGRHRVEVEPFALSPDRDLERALADEAARYNARLETKLREDPSQWLWMYGRWRRFDRLRG